HADVGLDASRALYLDVGGGDKGRQAHVVDRANMTGRVQDAALLVTSDARSGPRQGRHRTVHGFVRALSRSIRRAAWLTRVSARANKSGRARIYFASRE